MSGPMQTWLLLVLYLMAAIEKDTQNAAVGDRIFSISNSCVNQSKFTDVWKQIERWLYGCEKCQPVEFDVLKAADKCVWWAKIRMTDFTDARGEWKESEYNDSRKLANWKETLLWSVRHKSRKGYIIVNETLNFRNIFATWVLWQFTMWWKNCEKKKKRKEKKKRNK